MIRAIDLDDNGEKEIDVKSLQALSLRNVWLELVNPTNEELQEVSAKIGVSTHFLELPKTEDYIKLRLEDDLVGINFVMLKDDITTEEYDPIVIIFSKSFLVTVLKRADQRAIAMAKARMNKIKVDPPAQVAFLIIDEIVSGHYAQLEKLEELTSHVEEEVVERTTQDTLKKIFNLKTKLVGFNKTLWYERGLIFNLKTCSDTCMPIKIQTLFNTTHEDLTRQIDIVETYREILSDAINVHLSAVSNKINLSIQSLTVVIFYLTVITTLTAFPNTVATFFGISQFGNTNVGIILIAILLSTILPLLWLWRRKWLKYKPQP
jgi:magnesium transporter